MIVRMSGGDGERPKFMTQRLLLLAYLPPVDGIKGFFSSRVSSCGICRLDVTIVMDALL